MPVWLKYALVFMAIGVFERASHHLLHHYEEGMLQFAREASRAIDENLRPLTPGVFFDDYFAECDRIKKAEPKMAEVVNWIGLGRRATVAAVQTSWGRSASIKVMMLVAAFLVAATLFAFWERHKDAIGTALFWSSPFIVPLLLSCLAWLFIGIANLIAGAFAPFVFLAFCAVSGAAASLFHNGLERFEHSLDALWRNRTGK